MVGQTLGYSRSSGSYHHHGNPKHVWVYQLHRHAKVILSAVMPHPLLTNTPGVDVNTLPITGDGGLLAVLEQLRDPRKKRGIRHKVAAILTMVAAATLAGNRSFRSVADWVGDLPQDALARLGARKHHLTGRYIPPSEATIRRNVKDIDADEADALIGDWLMAQVLAGRLAAEKIPTYTGLAIDGKTLKGAWTEENTGNGKVRLFSALTHGEGVIVGQRAIPAQTTEVTQVLPLLDTISGQQSAISGEGQSVVEETDPASLAGTVITADALHVHRDNIEAILDRGGEYALTVKNNQPTLRAELEKLFPSAEGDGSFSPAPHHV
jgi:hypothetical protein